MAAEKIFIAGAIEILKKLSSIPEEEIKLILGMKKEFKKLKETVPMIQAVVRDAEIRQEKDGRIRLWLKRIKDVAYEVDDILDEFSFEDMRRRMEIPNSKMKEVTNFFSPKNPIAFRTKMAHMIKDINEKLDKIEKDMKMFNFEIGNVNDHSKNDMDRATDASLDNSQIFGREKEKSMLIDMLIGNSSNEEVFSVIPIVGIGGLGKTTLAKMVYNDESVVEHFEKKMWICVSDNFEVSRLIKEMLECLIGVNSNLSNLQAIQNNLGENLRGKRFLLVLDDVWNCSHEKWDKLRASLVIGAKGSKIVVTTRIEKLESIMGTLPPLHLTGLSKKESWDLFKIKAFRSGGATMNPNVVRIAEGLVGKCKGVPLAIKSLSALMYSQRNEYEWLSIQEQGSEIWNESEIEDGNGILPVLKLSFDHLSSPLKQCFAYCSIFPKDYKIYKKTLIQLWMAEGLLQSSSSSSSSASTSSTTLTMEDIGDKYFRSLVWNSFFQDVERDEHGEEVACKMHDLMHDLAQLITGNEHMIVEDFSKVQPNLETRYLSLAGKINTEAPETFYIMKKLRTHLCLDRYPYYPPLYHISDDRFFNFRSLRVLGLNNAGISSLPSSIEKLKHLRYLDLTGNKFPTFPESITNLYYLQTLKMSHSRLPEGITKMINLRHLQVIGNDRVIIYPKGIGRLTDLQTLEYFKASSEGEDDTEGAAGIEELENLQQLGGILHLFNLRCLKKNNAFAANLKEKPRLKELHLIWSSSYSEADSTWGERSTVNGNGIADYDNSLLESLRPHSNLLRLEIFRFIGTKTPTWMNRNPYLSSLQDLQLNHCHNIKSLDLFGLSSLRRLRIECCRDLTSLGLLKGLTALEDISLKKCKNLSSIGLPAEDSMPVLISLKSLEISGCISLDSLLNGFFSHLTSLNTLLLSDCSLLKTLPESIRYLSLLRELNIRSCPSLFALPKNLGNLLLLKKFVIEYCPGLVALPEGLGELSSLEELVIRDCINLTALPKSLGNLSALEKFVIEHCPGLVALPEELGKLSSLQELVIRGCIHLTALPHSLGNLSALKKFVIEHCLGLVAFPEGLGKLSSLQELVVRGCVYLTALPHSLGNLSALEKLEMRNCIRIVALPGELGNLSSLQELIIRDCDSLAELPESLGDLPSLEELIISHCPGLGTLPESLGDLTSLRQLSISHCRELVTLPEHLGNLLALKELKIFHCPSLVELPEGLGNLSSVWQLNINGCDKLTALPESLGNSSSFQRLYISSCQNLMSLPDLRSLRLLNIMDCPHLEAIYETDSYGHWPQQIAHIPDITIHRSFVAPPAPGRHHWIELLFK